MKRISKRVRMDAAMICAVQASTPNMTGSSPHTGAALGAVDGASGVAYAAWSIVVGEGPIGPTQDDLCAQYAEAEALLRTGWTPST